RTVGAFTSDFFRLTRRFFRLPGVTIVFLGPDGSGKSSVIPKVIENLRHSFTPDKGLQVHWKPVVFFPTRRRNRAPTTNPHAQPPRSGLSSFAFLAYHWVEFYLGYWLRIRPVLFRNGMVTID